MEQRSALRSMFASKGWDIWDGALKDLEEDCIEEVAAVEDERMWRVAKGHLAMVRKVRDLAEDLVKVSEEGHEQWVQKRVEAAMAEMEEMQALLIQGRATA